MKSIKLNFAVIAFLLGSGVAVASSANKFDNVKWGKQGTTYVRITDDYNCDNSANTCTRTYPAGQDPNINPDGYILQELGDFAQ